MELRVIKLESSVARLEADVGHIQNDVAEIKGDIREIKKEARTDFRLLFSAVVTATLGLAVLIARGFAWF